MFSTAYYRLILLLTFESADRVAKVKREIGSETTVKLRSGCYAWLRHATLTELCGIPPFCSEMDRMRSLLFWAVMCGYATQANSKVQRKCIRHTALIA